MEDLVKALSELYLMSARAGETSEDRRAVVALYARKLRDYPDDVALDAVTGYRGKFFPTFEELRTIIGNDRRVSVRLQKQAALKAFLNGEDTTKGPPPTPEQIERNAQWVSETRGDKPQPLSQEKLDRLAEVDRVHGKAARPTA